MEQHLNMSAGVIQSMNGFEVARDIGVTDKAEADRIFSYLKDAGLIRFMAMGPQVSITRAGIDAVESALAAPDEPTRSFGPINVLNVVGGIHGSQIQQGVHSSTQTQSVDWSGFRVMVPLLRETLTTLSRDDASIASAHVTTVEAHSASPAPSVGIVRESLTSLRSIFEKAGGNVAAEAISTWLRLQGWL